MFAKNTYAILFIVIVILIIAGIARYIMNPKNTKQTGQKTGEYEILSLSTFTCEGMNEVSFEYPIFKRWEVLLSRSYKSSKDKCVMYLNDPTPISERVNPEMLPRIQVIKESFIKKMDSGDVAVPINKNLHNVPYIEHKADNYVAFYGDSIIRVELISVLENYGFSKEQFF